MSDDATSISLSGRFHTTGHIVDGSYLNHVASAFGVARIPRSLRAGNTAGAVDPPLALRRDRRCARAVDKRGGAGEWSTSRAHRYGNRDLGAGRRSQLGLVGAVDGHFPLGLRASLFKLDRTTRYSGRPQYSP